MNIQQWKERLNKYSDEHLQRLLQVDVLPRIALLEGIYQTGGEHKGFSKEFEQAALDERQALCQKSSAIYSIQRQRAEVKE